LDVRDTNTYWVDFAGPGEAPRHSNKRDHDEEAEGDLHDPEVTEGDRPAEREAPTLDAPSDPLGATVSPPPASAATPLAPPVAAQNAPK
jgi:hypothetical protein